MVGTFHVACATCSSCLRGDYHRCRNGRTFGHGSRLGDLQGAQAEQLVCRWADVNLRRVPEGMASDVALFAGDVMGTGYRAVANAGMKEGDTVAVLGLGPVGLCAVQATLAGGAARVFGADSVAERLALAESFGATPLHLTESDVKAAVRAATDGAGADVVVDAVGDPAPLALAVSLARDAGTVSGVGVYAGKAEVPLGLAWLKSLRPEARRRQRDRPRRPRPRPAGERRLDPAPLVSSHMKLDDASEAYRIFENREALKIVLTP